MHDLTVIGAGPAGLSAAREARLEGMSCVVLERGVVGDTIYRYPLGIVLFSSSNEVEIEQGALPSKRKPTREEVLTHYNSFAHSERLWVRCGQEVEAISKTERGFTVETKAASYSSRTVLAAIGGFGRQRTLGVPGEGPGRVSYRMVDPAPYRNQRIVVAGGGNSAAEAALSLARAGAYVTMCVRAASLDPEPDQEPTTAAIKPWVREPLEKAAAEGMIRIHTAAQIASIDGGAIMIKTSAGLSERVECAHVFALIGADPDTRLLRAAGVSIADDGRPVYNPLTNETTVGGLFVAGHLTRERHIKSAIESARKVVRTIAGELREGGIRYGRAQG